jgi:hypothetical protein
MFDAFKSVFLPDVEADNNEVVSSADLSLDDQLGELLLRYGGKSFNQGLYRVCSIKSIAYWNELILTAFPSFADRITCFGVDWLGRFFALDSARLEGMRPGVVMFEAGTAEALEIPCNIESFHDSELIHYQEEALAASFYRQWLACGGASPMIAQCVGYKQPLFLGGSDTVQNLVMSDLDVYWTIAAQLIQKVKGLPSGTLIGRATIS